MGLHTTPLEVSFNALLVHPYDKHRLDSLLEDGIYTDELPDAGMGISLFHVEATEGSMIDENEQSPLVCEWRALGQVHMPYSTELVEASSAEQREIVVQGKFVFSRVILT